MSETTPLRIANCSGFFGDRVSAAREMIDGGPIDVLTGDWLAELTMGLLAKQQLRKPGSGFARTFVTQLDDVLGDCLDRGIKIVSNAGGLDPHGCAAQVAAIAERLGRTVRVAVVDGDDATEVFARERAGGWDAPHLDSGQALAADVDPIVVNAYLGAWGIVEALRAGADVVITGRVTDAAVIVGPAAWRFGWDRTEWDALAGAVAAGHVIECGAQACGGNYSFFTEISDMSEVGFPIAEIYPDGSSVITKHPGTGGAVTTETVTAQLLYEIDGPRYANPDVITRLDTVHLEAVGVDRVRLSGVRGEPAPATVKVGAVLSGGWRNETTFVLTGTEIEKKARVVQDALWRRIPDGEKAFDSVTVRLLRADRSDPATMEQAVALLTITVTGADRQRVSRFSRAAVEIGLATYPGAYFTAPPGNGTEFTVFWPTLMRSDFFDQRVTLGENTWTVPAAPSSAELPAIDRPIPPTAKTFDGPTQRLPLGTLLGARSGDKAGNATLGVWARNDEDHTWLRSWWSEDTVRELVPEAAGCELRLWELPLLRACGVTLVGLLGRGVAANPQLDSQAKGLGEYLRAKHLDIPTALLPLETR
ncbi:acyclic terpene utilization AtuA family protein [Rhodococcus chondri]|uniref:Acyclic terpene utilization AtuA family protein n=1 Tax=Rhodococcus chondri TaxID=3065941 RepID=A0ABU7JMI7_9NOCA|nr:acyclic terpene utilization AtuA family protein [Rhodococcus sp. CC-R104]MEE2031256.1 acyclic terpene utilization AtuA family protein [Rhodococcus sp. CC-R104]